MQTQSIQLSYSSLNKKKSHRGLTVGVVIILVLVVILVAMIALLVVDNKVKDSHSYGVIFSAGKDSTTAYIYKWEWGKKGKNLAYLDFTEVDYLCRTNSSQDAERVAYPGIVQVWSEDSYENVTTYFEDLISTAKCIVPSSLWKSTPIYVRLLEESGVSKESASVRERLFADLREVVRDSGFKVTGKCVLGVTTEEQNARVWLAVNYLKESIYNVDDSKKAYESTYGVFSLTENANSAVFVPHESIKRYGHDINAGKRVYKLYDYSSQAYGKESAHQMLLDNEIAKSPSLDVIQFPCYPKGYNRTYNGHIFNGTGEGNSCIKLTTNLLNVDASCEEEEDEGSCAINGTYMPNVTSNGYNVFYAVDEFYKTASFLSLSTGIPTTLEHLSKYTERYCNINLSGDYSYGRIHSACFDGSYAFSILRAYGFHKQDLINFANNIEGIEFNYPYGAMLHEIIN